MWRMSKDKRPNPLRNYDATDRELIAVLRKDGRAPIAIALGLL